MPSGILHRDMLQAPLPRAFAFKIVASWWQAGCSTFSIMLHSKLKKEKGKGQKVHVKWVCPIQNTALKSHPASSNYISLAIKYVLRPHISYKAGWKKKLNWLYIVTMNKIWVLFIKEKIDIGRKQTDIFCHVESHLFICLYMWHRWILTLDWCCENVHFKFVVCNSGCVYPWCTDKVGFESLCSPMCSKQFRTHRMNCKEVNSGSTRGFQTLLTTVGRLILVGTKPNIW